jgi:hypothetical protein
MADPTEAGFILPGLVGLRKPEHVWEESRYASKSTVFHFMRDRLIQQQWQSDREQQWRIEHEDQNLGSLARLPLEVRCQIYRACFPTECTETNLIWKTGSNLMSLIRTTHCIYNEIKPLLDRHAQSRVFNLVLSDNCIRFERKQLAVGFLTQQEIQFMSSETFLPLGIFARTLPRIRSLRLVMQLDSVVPPTGLVAVLQPFAMWVFSLIARAETLRYLMVDFLVNFNMDDDTLLKLESADMDIGQLIAILLGIKAATHCRKILKQALTSELQVVRFVVYQKPNGPDEPEKFIRSWRWNRPAHPSRSPEAIDQQNQSLLRKSPSPAAETVESRESPEHVPPPEVSVGKLPKENALPVESIEPRGSPEYSTPALVTPVESIERRKSSHYTPPAPISSVESVESQESPKYLLPPPTPPVQSVERRPSPRYSLHLPAPLLESIEPQASSQNSSSPSALPIKSIEPPASPRYSPPPLALSFEEVECQDPPKYPPVFVEPVESIEQRQPPIKDLPSAPSRRIKSAKPRESSQSSFHPSVSIELEGSIRTESQPTSKEPFWVDSDVESENDASDEMSVEESTHIVTPSLNSPASSPNPIIDETRHKPEDATIGIDSNKRLRRCLRATSKELSSPPKERQTPAKKRRREDRTHRRRRYGRYVVKRLLEEKVERGIAYMKVKWQGYHEETWEPRAQLNEDVPHMVMKFDRKRREETETAQAQARRARDRPRQMAKENGAVLLKESVPPGQTPATTVVKPKVQEDGLPLADQAPTIPTEEKRKAESKDASLETTQTQTPTPTSTPSRKPSRKPPFKDIKKPLPAMALYTQANRSAIALDLCNALGHPGLVEEAKVTTEGARRWLALGAETRAVWERLHAKRVAAYHVQMEAWRAGRRVPSLEEARGVVERRGVWGGVSVVDLT